VLAGPVTLVTDRSPIADERSKQKRHIATARWRSRPQVEIVTSHFQSAAVGNSMKYAAPSPARTTVHRAYRRREFSSKHGRFVMIRFPSRGRRIPKIFRGMPVDFPKRGLRFPKFFQSAMGAPTVA
jgi:hypothetical protein